MGTSRLSPDFVTGFCHRILKWELPVFHRILHFKNKTPSPAQECLRLSGARAKLLEGAFTVDRKQTAGKRLLLFDDLYRSGATMKAVAKELIEAGGATEVSVLALTYTRSKQ